jgi:hypothetical protein
MSINHFVTVLTVKDILVEKRRSLTRRRMFIFTSAEKLNEPFKG